MTLRPQSPLTPRWPLRVLQMSTQLTTAQKFIVPFARHLRSRGHQVTIACSGREYSDAKRYVEEIREAEFEVVEIDIPRTIDPAGDASAFLETLALLQRRRFDVVHTHNAKAGLIGRLAAWTMRVPMIVHTVHGLAAYVSDRYTPAQSEAHIALERVATRLTDRLFMVSEEELQKALAHRVAPREKMTLIGQGIDIRFFDRNAAGSDEVEAFRTQWDLGDSPVVGCVARLTPEKGVDALVACWGAVVSRTPEAKLVIIGDGPERPDLERWVRDAGLSSSVRFCAFIKERRQIRAAYAAMDVFALPTRWESFGVAFVEAMSMGVAVVAPRMEPVTSVVGQGTGMLLTDRAPDTLADALSELLTSPNLRAELGKAGRQRSTRLFDENDLFKRMESDYLALWQQKTPGGEIR